MRRRSEGVREETEQGSEEKEGGSEGGNRAKEGGRGKERRQWNCKLHPTVPPLILLTTPIPILATPSVYSTAIFLVSENHLHYESPQTLHSCHKWCSAVKPLCYKS